MFCANVNPTAVAAMPLSDAAPRADLCLLIRQLAAAIARFQPPLSRQRARRLRRSECRLSRCLRGAIMLYAISPRASGHFRHTEIDIFIFFRRYDDTPVSPPPLSLPFYADAFMPLRLFFFHYYDAAISCDWRTRAAARRRTQPMAPRRRRYFAVDGRPLPYAATCSPFMMRQPFRRALSRAAASHANRQASAMSCRQNDK